QVVELAHVLEDSIWLIDQILAFGPNEEEKPLVVPRPSRGVGVVDAPQGVLLHDYTYDVEGAVTEASILTPTAENLGNLDADLRAYREQLNGVPEEEMRKRRAMLVRSYDPSVSCSTH
ncbi:MAG: nickel-dependent hydrogenase large subunit, partial [Armatimonadota bacterium]